MFSEQTDNLWLSQFAINISNEDLHGNKLVEKGS
jgi:hypothetical protein